MLKKENRLVKGSEFNEVYKFGKKLRSSSFETIYLDVSNYKGPSKFGFVVSNKFNKVAPKRNKTKRILREIVRLKLDSIKDGYWIIMRPYKNIESKSYEEIDFEFNKILSEAPFAKKHRN